MRGAWLDGRAADAGDESFVAGVAHPATKAIDASDISNQPERIGMAGTILTTRGKAKCLGFLLTICPNFNYDERLIVIQSEVREARVGFGVPSRYD